MLHSLVAAIQAISGKNTQYTGTFDLLVSLLSDYETSNEVLVLKMIGNSLIAAPRGLSRSSTWAVVDYVTLPWLSQSPHSGSREPVAPTNGVCQVVCLLLVISAIHTLGSSRLLHWESRPTDRIEVF